MLVHQAGGPGCRDALSPPTPCLGFCLIFSKKRNDRDRVAGAGRKLARAGRGRANYQGW